MKNVFLFSILFCAIALPALGELTDADLNKIRLIISEEIEKESSTTNKKIDALDAKIDTLDARIQNVEKDVAWVRGKLDGIDKQITHATNITYVLIALIVATIAAPLILIAMESRTYRSFERQVEMLTREIETLKQQRIVNP